ncbi:MAG: sirohydrochlorin chelatase [Chloroflexota bacterium]
MDGTQLAPPAVLVIAHGSRDAAACTELVAQVAGLRDRLEGVTVKLAVLEFPGDHAPSIQDAVDGLVATGVERFVVLPLFLFDAGHVRHDIPAELEAARRRHPSLNAVILPQLDISDGLMEVLIDRLRTANGRLGSPEQAHTAILLIGAGTSAAHANAELHRVAEQLRNELSLPLVEVAFVSLAHPTVPEGVARCVAQGARRIVTTHYFLNTGVLARRIESQARAEAERLGVEVSIGQHFGTHEALAEALARRVRRALSNEAEVSQGEEPEYYH